MTYPTMPRPDDNTGDNHRAAISALEQAIARNRSEAEQTTHVRDTARRTMERANADLETFTAQREALQRGIDALKAADR